MFNHSVSGPAKEIMRAFNDLAYNPETGEIIVRQIRMAIFDDRSRRPCSGPRHKPCSRSILAAACRSE
jgi:hypothetical protein